MRNGIDEGFCLLTSHLSYRRKFIRSALSHCLGAAIAVGLQISGLIPMYFERLGIPHPVPIGWALIGFGVAVGSLKVWHEYLRWRIEDRRALKRARNRRERERRQAEAGTPVRTRWMARAALCEALPGLRVVDVELPEGRFEIEYRTDLDRTQTVWVDEERIEQYRPGPWLPMRVRFEFRLGARDADIEVLFTAFTKSIRSFRVYVEDELVYCDPEVTNDEAAEFDDRPAAPSDGIRAI
jgi:hypothetical protein